MGDGRGSPASRVCYMEEEYLYGCISTNGDVEVERGVNGLGLGIEEDPCDAEKSPLVRELEADGVEVVAPGSEEYEAAIKPFNLRVSWRPLAVAVPSTAEEVAMVVRCAGKHNVKVAARSGGHSYAGYGLGGKDGSLVVDMKKFRTLELDPETNVATLGAGLRLGDVAVGLFEKGGRALPHGLCPGVGLAGHALHGGFGLTSRMWGTTLDTILSMQVVLADGRVVDASESENGELFWALRGAGSSFGIVTVFRVKTLPAPESGVIFRYHFPSVRDGDVKTKVKIFTAFQNYSITHAPRELALRMWIATDEFDIRGAYWGNIEEFRRVFQLLLDALPVQPLAEIGVHPWLNSLYLLANGKDLIQPETYTAHDTFFAKSLVAPDPLAPKALERFFSFLSAHRSGELVPVKWWVICELNGGNESEVSARSPEEAAYAGRDALWTFQMYSMTADMQPPYPQEGVRFMERMWGVMPGEQRMGWRAYPNYVDDSLERGRALKWYYGELLKRLGKVKRRFDPGEMFWNPQSVGVAHEGE